ncbi:MAG: putative aminohydrolase SsnA [Clostridia bacterium]|jgi:putative selenium metabolism protein SsnA|nr:putative aminohydrolase SsnA [Clostridia bacterium]
MLLVGNGLLITLDEKEGVRREGAVAIEGNLIKEVGDTNALKEKYPQASFLDARGKVIMPGLINTHTHLYSTFARGIALKDPPPKNFLQILERLWWRLDKALTLEDVYYSALISLVDCVKNGTTTIMDHHASPFAVRGSLRAIARAAREVGVRSCLCYEVSDRDGEEIAGEGIEENAGFIEESRQAKDDLLAASFGLHASFTLSDRTLKACKEVSARLDTGFHLHAAEDMADVEDSLKKSGKRVIERLADFCILGPKTIIAHCVHVDDHEIDLLASTGTNVVHNPQSNMGNAVGYSPVAKMLDEGVVVGLGTDGFTADMFESIKAANVLHKFALADPSAFWKEVPQLVFVNNAKIASRFFPKPLGKLVPGAYADLIVVDYYPPSPLTEDNYYGHILFGMAGRAVETTIINGRVLMENRRLLLMEEELTAKCRELAAGVWERF